MDVFETSFSNIRLEKVNIIEGEINHGFIYKNYVVITADELFQNTIKKQNYNTKYKYATSIHDVNKLEVGDYVVHNTHGIGIYNGIKTLSLNNIEKDYLEVLSRH